MKPTNKSQFLCWFEDDANGAELHDTCDDPLEAAERHVSGLYEATGEVLWSSRVIVEDWQGRRHTVKVTAEMNVSFSGCSID